MNKICYIFGAGNCEGAVISENSFIISADGGYKYLKENNITPNLILGDFDSLGYIPKENNVLVFPKEKDYTDTAIAVEKAVEMGFNTFVIYGGLGGRLDHSLANIQLTENLSKKGYKAFLVGKGNVITAITNGEIAFSKENKGFVSVFALCENAKGVTISGLKYNLKNVQIKNTNALGVSNEFIGEKAKISVKKGTLTILWQESPKEFLARLN